MYMEAARRYREILARAGVELVLLKTSGSIENIGMLGGRRPAAHLAFIQGGTVPSDTPNVEALGSVFLEPLWVFARTQVQAARLAELRGRRIAVGAPGSGTRALAVQLLQASGIETGMLDLGGQDAVTALLGGTVDVARFDTADPLPLLEPLLRPPRVRLLSLPRADAFTRRYPFLTKGVLPWGALALAHDVPPRDVTLLAPAASLVASAD